MKNIKNKINITIIALLIFVGTIGISATKFFTLAFFTSEDSVTNVINTGDVDIEVSEDFETPTDWNGESYEKKVQIQNKSKSPALIRVALVPRWVDEDDNPWPGDTSIVNLNYTTDNIIQTEGPYDTKTNKWVNGNDGYYYYNTIVPTGEDTTEILSSVSATIPEELKERYKGKTLIVDVKAEAVQATVDAYEVTWSNIEKNSDIYNMLKGLCGR